MNLNDPIDVLTRTIYGEARGEREEGIVAVAWVVRNRADNPRWWGHDVCSVCLCPWQFSCWNKDDPNLPVISALNAGSVEYERLAAMVRAVLSGSIPDPTGGADSYFAAYLTPPNWTHDAVFTRRIGQQLFYRAVLGVPAAEHDGGTSATAGAPAAVGISGNA